jgi:hypothetical protein
MLLFRKAVTAGLIGITLLSFSGNSIMAYAVCSNIPQEIIDQENKRIDQIKALPTRQELASGHRKNFNAVSEKVEDKDIKQAIIRQYTKNQRTNQKLKITRTSEIDGAISGTLDIHNFTEYGEDETGYSVEPYTFVYNSKTKTIQLNSTSLEFTSKTYDTKPTEPSIEEQVKILKNKQLHEEKNVKTVESVKADSKKQPNIAKIKDKAQTCLSIKASAYAGGNYDKFATKYYALAWGSGRNNDYYDYSGKGIRGNGSDCSNFASQSVFAGGLAKNYGLNDSYSKDWYFHWNYPWYGGRTPVNSVTWTAVPEQMSHMFWHENTSIWYTFNYGEYFYLDSKLFTGDLIFMDWQNDGVYDHVYVITGFDFNYNTKHWEPRLSAHDQNRTDDSWSVVINAMKVKNNLNVVKFTGLHINSYIW